MFTHKKSYPTSVKLFSKRKLKLNFLKRNSKVSQKHPKSILKVSKKYAKISQKYPKIFKKYIKSILKVS